MKAIKSVFCAFAIIAGTFAAQAGLHVMKNVKENVVLRASDDYHITAASDAIAPGATVDLSDPDSRLFFDNIRPSDVIERYSGSITIGGEKLEPEKNARICVYRHGTEILPHGASYTPLEGFGLADFGGDKEVFLPGFYYSNAPSKDVAAENIKDLSLDNKMQSFRLARGYMATLATNPDGTGYSRCFIAEDGDLCVGNLPAELAGKVSFVRVFLWQRPSKKGWVGGNGKTDPPEGYFDEQCDFTGSTWAYCWGTSADWCSSPESKGKRRYNQEFVPEKWGRGGENDWKIIANDMLSSHLLSYNEPDHSEQSNVSVEQAIAEWPRHLRTGMRLGSPATTDFRWIYDFMKKCREHNYRVDYVAIHAYWGGRGSSVQVNSVRDWYNKLREVHEKTGCPLWITEWNNGANWTHEAWPSDKAGQQEKQRKFMEEVLAMMDTCSFIERYSVYNWVEEKRALFWQNKNLTPAGVVYRDFKAAPAFSRKCEVIPVWEINSTPELTLSYLGNRMLSLGWTDESIEQVSAYEIEQAAGESAFTRVASLPPGTSAWTAAVPDGVTGDLRYRVVSVDGTHRAAESAVKSIGLLADSGTPLFGRKTVEKGQSIYLLPESCGSDPVILTGLQTYCMKSPMLMSARTIDTGAVSFGPEMWNYNKTATFVSRDTVPFMIFPRSGAYNIGGLDAEAGTLEAVKATDVRHVAFARPFESAPAVFVTVGSQNSGAYPAVAVVGNVTAEGFDVTIMREGKVPAAAKAVGETVHYAAIATGSGSIGGREIVVGRVTDASMGVSNARSMRVDYGRSLGRAAFFATLSPSGEETIASTLRVSSMSGTGTGVFANYEKSGTGSTPATIDGSLAWCAIADAATASASATVVPLTVLVHDAATRSLRRADGAAMTSLNVCDASGRCILAADGMAVADTSVWNSGIYIARAEGCPAYKFALD